MSLFFLEYAAWVALTYGFKVAMNEKNLAFIKDHNLTLFYLAALLVKVCSVAIGVNLGEARRAAQIPLPDQHVYKGRDGNVLMDNEGSNGRFNRAQRGLQKYVGCGTGGFGRHASHATDLTR